MTADKSAVKYEAGDVATVEGKIAVYIPHRWEWLDGSWTAIPLSVGPLLGNVFEWAERAVFEWDAQ